MQVPRAPQREAAIEAVRRGAAYPDAAGAANVDLDVMYLAIRAGRAWRKHHAGRRSVLVRWGHELEEAAAHYMRFLRDAAHDSASPRYALELARQAGEVWASKYGVPDIAEDHAEPWGEDRVTVDEEYDADARRADIERSLAD